MNEDHLMEQAECVLKGLVFRCGEWQCELPAAACKSFAKNTSLKNILDGRSKPNSRLNKWLSKQFSTDAADREMDADIVFRATDGEDLAIWIGDTLVKDDFSEDYQALSHLQLGTSYTVRFVRGLHGEVGWREIS